jgi:hypothetical protein
VSGGTAAATLQRKAALLFKGRHCGAHGDPHCRVGASPRGWINVDHPSRVDQRCIVGWINVAPPSRGSTLIIPRGEQRCAGFPALSGEINNPHPTIVPHPTMRIVPTRFVPTQQCGINATLLPPRGDQRCAGFWAPSLLTAVPFFEEWPQQSLVKTDDTHWL